MKMIKFEDLFLQKRVLESLSAFLSPNDVESLETSAQKTFTGRRSVSNVLWKVLCERDWDRNHKTCFWWKYRYWHYYNEPCFFLDVRTKPESLSKCTNADQLSEFYSKLQRKFCFPLFVEKGGSHSTNFDRIDLFLQLFDDKKPSGDGMKVTRNLLNGIFTQPRQSRVVSELVLKFRLFSKSSCAAISPNGDNYSFILFSPITRGLIIKHPSSITLEFWKYDEATTKFYKVKESAVKDFFIDLSTLSVGEIEFGPKVLEWILGKTIDEAQILSNFGSYHKVIVSEE